MHEPARHVMLRGFHRPAGQPVSAVALPCRDRPLPSTEFGDITPVRGAHTHLGGSLTGRVGHHAVGPYGRQAQGDRRQHDEQEYAEATVRDRLAHHLAHAGDAGDGYVLVACPDLLPEHADQPRRIGLGADHEPTWTTRSRSPVGATCTPRAHPDFRAEEARIAHDTDDGERQPQRVVDRDALPDRVGVGEELSYECFIDDRHGRTVGTVSIGEGTSLQQRCPKRAEVTRRDWAPIDAPASQSLSIP